MEKRYQSQIYKNKIYCYTLKVTRMRRSSEIPFILLWYKIKNRHLKKNV